MTDTGSIFFSTISNTADTNYISLIKRTPIMEYFKPIFMKYEPYVCRSCILCILQYLINKMRSIAVLIDNDRNITGYPSSVFNYVFISNLFKKIHHISPVLLTVSALTNRASMILFEVFHMLITQIKYPLLPLPVGAQQNVFHNQPRPH